MGYHYKRKESVLQATRRVVRELVEEAIDYAESSGDPDERVHEIRKNLKRARAAFRLIRTSTVCYSEENRRYRDIGRLLSDLRDMKARLETVERNRERLLGVMGVDAYDALRISLLRKHAEAFADGDIECLMEDVMEQLEEGLQALAEVDISDDGWDAVAGGLAKTYGRAVDRFEEARVDGSVETFHTWRKRVKYHRYHIDLLRNAWKPVLKEWEDQLHDVTDHLGEDHDLAVLEETLVESSSMLEDPVALERARAALRKRSARHRERALALAARAFAETPEEIVRRLGAYWAAWKS